MVNNRVEFLWDREELQTVTAKMMSWKQTILLFTSCDYAIKNVLDVLPEGVNLWIPWWRVQLSQNFCARDQSLSGYDAGVLFWKYLWLSRSDDVGHSFRASAIPPFPLPMFLMQLVVASHPHTQKFWSSCNVGAYKAHTFLRGWRHISYPQNFFTKISIPPTWMKWRI